MQLDFPNRFLKDYMENIAQRIEKHCKDSTHDSKVNNTLHNHSSGKYMTSQ